MKSRQKFKKSSYKGNRFANYSIEMYLGEVRSGKTLTMVAETYEQTKGTDAKVYSNIHLNKKLFPRYKYITRQDLIGYYNKKEQFKNAIFLIDEIHIFADARKFMNKDNQAIGYFVGQMGKRGNTLRGTTHFDDLIDYRIRLYCERWVYIEKGLLEGRKWKPILNNNRILTKEENKVLCIKATSIVRKMLNYKFYSVPIEKKYVMAEQYFELYDTEEVVGVDDTIVLEQKEKEKIKV